MPLRPQVAMPEGSRPLGWSDGAEPVGFRPVGQVGARPITMEYNLDGSQTAERPLQPAVAVGKGTHCAATTKAGKPCKGIAASDTEFCMGHLNGIAAMLRKESHELGTDANHVEGPA